MKLSCRIRCILNYFKKHHLQYFEQNTVSEGEKKIWWCTALKSNLLKRNDSWNVDGFITGQNFNIFWENDALEGKFGICKKTAQTLRGLKWTHHFIYIVFYVYFMVFTVWDLHVMSVRCDLCFKIKFLEKKIFPWTFFELLYKFCMNPGCYRLNFLK